ncbi:high affinity sulfate transporter [Artemisia annua]|uniref:High affinity sulfate transporter n=1 Tax=Artemisia annua TaxID=35608 RepID=A0A2U1LC88_ARTAN|nr:high affinity sulfate transporter [Artemisia annua]
MGGAAVTIALEQLKWLFGIKDFTEKIDIFSVMRSVINSAHHGLTDGVVRLLVGLVVAAGEVAADKKKSAAGMAGKVTVVLRSVPGVEE